MMTRIKQTRMRIIKTDEKKVKAKVKAKVTVNAKVTAAGGMLSYQRLQGR